MIRKFDNHDSNIVSNRKVLFGWVGTAKELREEIQKAREVGVYHDEEVPATSDLLRSEYAEARG